MQSIKRQIMLLRPCGSENIKQARTATLRMEKAPFGIALSLKADGLKPGDYSLYLFLKNGGELSAGNIFGGKLNSSLNGVELDDIACAAVISNTAGANNFCLRSASDNWNKIIEKFRLSRAPENAAKPEYIPEALPALDSAETPEIVSAPSEAKAAFFSDQQYDDETIQQGDSDHKKEGFEEDACDACTHITRESSIIPFPSVFPNSEWVKVSYPGPSGWWHYISGKIYKGNSLVATALGVPGEYGMSPPVWLEGFGTYLRCPGGDANGYWLMFQDAETGEVLDMGLSPHGA